jgi:formate hydrogenlyase subunit 4
MSSFTSSFTTSIAKQPTLCPTLWSASLKTHSHRVKHMVKLQKHGSLPTHEVAHDVILKKQLYR